MQLRHRMGQRINANFVGGWKERTSIKPLIKQQLRGVVDFDAKVVLLAIRICDCICYLLIQRRLCRVRKRQQMQLAIDPDSALYSSAGVFFLKLKRFESDDECGNDIARVGRKNRHSYHLIDNSAAGVRVSLDIDRKSV